MEAVCVVFEAEERVTLNSLLYGNILLIQGPLGILPGE